MLPMKAVRIVPGNVQMYRVVLSSMLVVLLAACSLGPKSLTAGVSEPPAESKASAMRKRPESVALGGDPSAPREAKTAKTAPTADAKVAALDQAPAGSYEKPQRGILSDRDYSSTNLNAEMARDLINQYRKEAGLKPLKLNSELTTAAKEHSRDLAKWDRISHYGSDGSNPWDRVKRTGYKARIAAENVGTGQISFEEVLKGWKESPGHNKNLLMGDAEHMGIALVQDPKTEFKSFWTLVLGSAM